MNQAIHFPDSEEWNESLQAIYFPAVINGFQVICGVAGKTIAGRYGGDGAKEWLSLFRRHRWDLEEEVQDLIIGEQEDDQGWYWLS